MEGFYIPGEFLLMIALLGYIAWSERKKNKNEKKNYNLSWADFHDTKKLN